MSKEVIAGIIALVVLAGASVYAFTHPPSPAYEPTYEPLAGEETYNTPPQQETRQGFVSCAPGKPGRSISKECTLALALEQSDGHVVLDFSVYQPTLPQLAQGEHIRVSGTVVPAVQLSAAHWQDYDIDGIMAVVSLERL